MKKNSKLSEDIDKLYQKYYVGQKQTYHEFCRTVCVSLGWPTQRVYPLIKPWFPGDLYNGEQSIYEAAHRYGF